MIKKEKEKLSVNKIFKSFKSYNYSQSLKGVQVINSLSQVNENNENKPNPFIEDKQVKENKQEKKVEKEQENLNKKEGELIIRSLKRFSNKTSNYTRKRSQEIISPHLYKIYEMYQDNELSIHKVINISFYAPFDKLCIKSNVEFLNQLLTDEPINLKENDKNKNFLIENNDNKISISLNIDQLFDNPEQVLKNDNEKIKISNENKTVDIKKIYNINKFLNYDNDKPLWYTYHKKAQSSFGPISSENIDYLYSNGLMNGDSLIRFIDLFSIDDGQDFKFFKLKNIESNSFLQRIVVSDLVKLAIKH